MKTRFFRCCGKGLLILAITSAPSLAQNKIVAMMDPSGKVMFTNNADNTPPSVPMPGVPAVPTAVSSDPTHHLIDSIAVDHGVDPALVKAMIHTESSFKRMAVSPKGAM